MDHAITKGIIESHNCHLAVKSFHLKPSKPNLTIKINELTQLFDGLNHAKLSRQSYLLICWSFLTELRPNEAVNIQWAEIDLAAKLWQANERIDLDILLIWVYRQEKADYFLGIPI